MTFHHLSILLALTCLAHSISAQTWNEQKQITDYTFDVNNVGTDFDMYDDVLVVSSPGHSYDAANENYLSNAGTVFVYRYHPDESNWILEQKLVPNDRTLEKKFGDHVAIHSEYIVIGAPYDGYDADGNPGDMWGGSAYFFKQNAAGFWVQTQKIKAPDGAPFFRFGGDIALTDSMAIIGAEGEGEPTTGTTTGYGAAYVFKLSPSGVWEFDQKITPSIISFSAQFGKSIGLFENTLAISAPGYPALLPPFPGQDSIPEPGAVYTFVYEDENWIETQRITAYDSIPFSDPNFNVSLTDSILAIGVRTESFDENGLDSLPNAGSVYIFKLNSAGSWEEIQKLVSPERQAFEQFGKGISFSGAQAVVGAPGDYVDAGKSYFFEKPDGTDLYLPQQTLEASISHQLAKFGKSVLVNDQYILVGAPADSVQLPGDIFNMNGSLFIFTNKGVFGEMYKDFNMDCVLQDTDAPLIGHLAQINPGNILVQSSAMGRWYLEPLPPGEYTITADTGNYWTTACSPVQTFTVENSNLVTITEPMGLYSTEECTDLSLSVNMPLARVGFSGQNIYVSICNWYDANMPAVPGYVDIQLHEWIAADTATIPMEDLGDNTFRFQLDTIHIGDCFNFQISSTLSTEAEMSRIICIQANMATDDCEAEASIDLMPANPLDCDQDYDNSFMQVEADCINDTVVFTVTNTALPGQGDMLCYSAVRLYEDGIWVQADSLQLAGGQSETFTIPGGETTWRLEVDQHPDHPGNSAPNATIEACGNTGAWVYTGAHFMHPNDDLDTDVDIDCVQITTSYDPNDKNAVPVGVGQSHEILPNGWLDYTIRFQNTGNDTAFTVVIRDTLDADLDIFSVESGVSSHPYQFEIAGPRVLKWTFNAILLPDSNVNEPASHGFVTFRVQQNPELPDQTLITNTAGIYFDFNDPIITNTVFHTIQRPESTPTTVQNHQPNSRPGNLTIYPNPNTGEFKLRLPDQTTISPGILTIHNTQGLKLHTSQNFSPTAHTLKADLPPGLYLVTFRTPANIYTGRVVIGK